MSIIPPVISKCRRCNQETSDWYMLKDAIWRRVGKVNERLCLACAEKRLGRKIVQDDFADIPLNYILGHLPWQTLTPDKKDIVLSQLAGEPATWRNRMAELHSLPEPTQMERELLFWIVRQFL